MNERFRGFHINPFNPKPSHNYKVGGWSGVERVNVKAREAMTLES